MSKRSHRAVGSNRYQTRFQSPLSPGSPQRGETSDAVHDQIAELSIRQKYTDISPSLLNSRPTLCRALDALSEQRDAFTIVGAHAVHEQTSHLDVESTATEDGDATVTPELVKDMPRIDEQMRAAGFRTASEMAQELPEGHRGRRFAHNLGLWGTSIDDAGDIVEEMDLIVPSSLVVGRSRRSVPNLKHHGMASFNKGAGNELATLERDEKEIVNFADDSVRTAWVAKPSGLICAKSYKITDRLDDVDRGNTRRGEKLPKDSADMLRCMMVSDPDEVKEQFDRHKDHPASGEAIGKGHQLFSRLVHDPRFEEYAARGADWPGGTQDVNAEVDRWRETF